MDYRNIGMGVDRHTIIYGHYSQNGQMFGELDKFLNEDFLKENLEFTFGDAYAERRYPIFPSSWLQQILFFWILILRGMSTPNF